VKSLQTMIPNLPTSARRPPVAPGRRLRDPDSKPAGVKVESSWTYLRLESGASSSVLPLEGGPTRSSQTGSPGSRFATTVPSTTCTGLGSGR
jgi:hypothetical protein